MVHAVSNLAALQHALQIEPSLVLSFYPYGIMLRRQDEDGRTTEYPIDPQRLGTLLAGQLRFDTGLLNPDTLYVSVTGVGKVVIGYRAPQKTALHIDGATDPIRVPLPGLILMRTTTSDDSPRYAVYAIPKRPTTLDTPLYYAPLPNVGSEAICWGSVGKVSAEALHSNDLQSDWSALLGSLFTSHSVSGKSNAHRDDIRGLYIALEKRKATRYPVRDLIPARTTLAEVLHGVEKTS